MKFALVTGASGGIGSAIAKALARDGYSVILMYNNSREKALLAQAGLAPFGVCSSVVGADVSDSSAVNIAIERVLSDVGHIDLLVNNAGLSQRGLVTETSDEEWQKIIGTNLTGVFNCCRAVLPSMIARQSGKIINIASIWGQTGASCEVAYSAAKAGVIGFTQALAKEVAPSNISVNCVSPGAIMTEMLDCYSQAEKDELALQIPQGRIGSPEDVAQAVAFLASSRADYITGQVLAVNGGMLI